MHTTLKMVYVSAICLVIAGCSEKTTPNEQPTPNKQPTQKLWDNTDIPKDWHQLRLSHQRTSDGVTISLTCQNQPLEYLVTELQDHMTKPIEFADGLDCGKKLPRIDLEMQNGDWGQFLKLVIEEHGFQLDETESEFNVVEKN